MSVMKIRVDGYLVQSKLEEALRALVKQDSWLGREVPVGGGRRQRWDMSYLHDGKVVVVEFDGDEHYRNSIKIKADREKDEHARCAGHKVVRFPYWLQLTSETLTHFFGLEGEIEQSFPHGFITTKVFPASFCELGVGRFVAEMSALPQGIAAKVIESLEARVVDHGLEYVLPKSLHFVLERAPSQASLWQSVGRA